jgi:hypothetical protein
MDKNLWQELRLRGPRDWDNIYIFGILEAGGVEWYMSHVRQRPGSGEKLEK